MAIKEQTPLTQNLLVPQQTIQVDNSFDQLGSALGTMGTLLSSKASELAIEEAAQRGQTDVLSNKQPESLMPPLTKATKAYNNAVSNTEARFMVQGAERQIQESYLNHANPQNFGPDSPAKFQAELKGIIQGTLENARDSNRALIAGALEQLETSASINMLKTSIQYDNKVVNDEFQNVTNDLLSQLQTAYIENNSGEIDRIKKVLGQSFDDYSVRSQAIAQSIPKIEEEIQKKEEVFQVLGEYSAAASEGRGNQFLADFVENKQNLPFDIWQSASKDVLSLRNTKTKLMFEVAAEENAQVRRGILNGSITTYDDIDSFQNLTAVQLENNKSLLETQTLKRNQDLVKIQEAQQLIKSNQAALIEPNVKDKMAKLVQSSFREGEGRDMTLFDMAESLNGTNNYPFSGLPNTPMNTDIPMVNKLMQASLTDKNPTSVATAGSVYNDIVNVQEKPNLLKLEGKAVDVAVAYANSVGNGSTEPQAAAQQAIDRVLNISDTELKQRTQDFRAIPEKEKRSMFKQLFNVDVNLLKNDNAYSKFKETLYNHYLNANSKDAALEGTKYSLRAWGESKYYDPGTVGDGRPEVEIPVAGIAYAFDNQFRSQLQNVINRNRANRALPDSATNKRQNLPEIEWLSPEMEIKQGELSDFDKVYRPLGIPNLPSDQGILKTSAERAAGIVPGTLPRIKINGQESPVILIPGPDLRYETGSLRYTLGYYDKFGNVHPLPDITNPKGVAQFVPTSLDKWAPGILDEQQQERLKAQAISYRKNALKATIQTQQKAAGVLSNLLSTDRGANPDIMLEYMTAGETGAQALYQALWNKTQGNSPTATRQALSSSAIVGLNAAPGENKNMANLNVKDRGE